MSTPTKPSIVFCHGIWADGSCFNKLLPPLQAEGYEVICAQYGLDTNVADDLPTHRDAAWCPVRTRGTAAGPGSRRRSPSPA